MTGAQVRRPWDGIISPDDIAVYRQSGFGQATGLGERPALLVIDVQYRTAGEGPLPILEAIRTYPTACGERAWQAIPNIAQLIEACRSAGIPVIFPFIAPKSEHDRAGFAAKVPGILEIPQRGYEFVKEGAPLSGELALAKAHASAFFGTALSSHLVRLGIDSLIVSGCSTSGCVRATAVDGCSLNYKIVVPEDAVYDRVAVSHAVNLFDMAAKYADVMPTRSLLPLLEGKHRADPEAP